MDLVSLGNWHNINFWCCRSELSTLHSVHSIDLGHKLYSLHLFRQWNRSCNTWPIIKTELLIYQSRANFDVKTLFDKITKSARPRSKGNTCKEAFVHHILAIENEFYF